MSNQDQKNLERSVKKLIKKYGKSGAIRVISSRPARGLYSVQNRVEEGLHIICESERGGVLIEWG